MNREESFVPGLAAMIYDEEAVQDDQNQNMLATAAETADGLGPAYYSFYPKDVATAEGMYHLRLFEI